MVDSKNVGNKGEREDENEMRVREIFTFINFHFPSFVLSTFLSVLLLTFLLAIEAG
jgi:hypothetical protein